MPKALSRLVEALASLPGIGQRSAERAGFWLLDHPETARALLEALSETLKLGRCSVCGLPSHQDPCPICRDPNREPTICVVEGPAEAFAIESLGFYQGKYHVLGGLIAPLEGVGPGDLRIGELVRRIRAERPREVILALRATVEGDATGYYILEELRELGVRVTRIGRGLATGAGLSLTDPLTLREAFEGRRELE